jgi:hypothetical protein
LAQTTIKAVVEMLKDCAPGATIELKTHFRHVHFGPRTYPSFPKHDDPDVFNVRKMARFFGILDCAKKHIPSI